jgi:hypothetical protein
MGPLKKNTAQLDADIAQALHTKKWQRDGIDRHETWWLGDEEAPIAQVHPEWGPTRGTGIGRPDYWIVLVGDKRARTETAAEGKKLALAMLKDATTP